ncbi:MAG TPA: STAS domain-containing protein [Acidimicrobiia bacterium]|nr:STAS domain-containing protein [Acidimicrobiia bacterium]
MHDSATVTEEFRLEVAIRGGAASIRLSGELDMLRARRLDEAFIAICSERVSNTDIDASGVSFIDCTGLRSVLVISEEMERRRGAMRIIDPSAPVQRLLQLAGCEDLVEEPGAVPSAGQEALA